LAEDAAEPIAHNNLGVLLMARGQLPDAERELREELRINPHYARAHHNLALVLRALGRDAEATPHWEASLARDPDDAEATRALADHRGPGGRP
jgi:Flp pilus assembly protein TadD